MTDEVAGPTPTVYQTSVLRPLAACCLFLASIGVTVEAQTSGPPDDYVVSAVTEGASLSPVVRAVLQTRDGYLWIATEAGISRFDGLEHHGFRATNTPALRHSIIRTLFEDAASALWIGTEHGLARYQAGRFEAIALPDTPVAGVAEDAADSVWIGTSQGLFEHREGRLIAHGNEPLLRGAEIQFVFADSRGRVWIGLSRRRGLVRYEKGVFESYVASEIAGDTVVAMAEGSDRALWFAMETRGVFRLNGERLQHFGTGQGLGSNLTLNIQTDRHGQVWVMGGGLFRWDGAGAFRQVKLPMVEGPRALTEDREGNYWIGTTGAGLWRMRSMGVRVWSAENGIPGGTTKSVTVDAAGGIWTALPARGVTRLTAAGTETIIPAEAGASGAEARLPGRRDVRRPRSARRAGIGAV